MTSAVLASSKNLLLLSSKIVRLVMHGLPLVSPCWLIPITSFSCAQKCTPRRFVPWLSQGPKWDWSTCSSLVSSSGLSCTFLMQHLFSTSHQGSPMISMTFKRQEKASFHGHRFSQHTWIQPGWAYGLLQVKFSVIHDPILRLIQVSLILLTGVISGNQF